MLPKATHRVTIIVVPVVVAIAVVAVVALINNIINSIKIFGRRYWIRTNDLHDVNVAL